MEPVPEKDVFDSQGKPSSPEVNRKLLAIYILVGAISLATLLLVVLFLHPYPILKTQTIELGQKVSLDPELYWDGLDVKSATLSDTFIDYENVGTYSLLGHAGVSNYEFLVTIVDTTAPAIVLKTDSVYLKPKEAYDATGFISDVKDFSDVTLSILYDGKERNSLSFDYIGTYHATIKASDSSGNSTEAEVSFIVDESPKLYGVSNVFIKEKTHFEPLSGVLAVDETDGNCTPDIKIVSSDLDVAHAGRYKIVYDVADSYDLHTTVERIVVVGNDAAINFPKETLTSEDLNLLCKSDCFETIPYTTSKSTEEVCQLVEPTLVNLFWTRSNGWASGSGFIYDITPDYVYIASVKHVAKMCEKNFTLTWFDGTSMTANSNYISNEEEDNELSLIRVPTSDIPVETLLKLREACTSKVAEAYESMETGDEVFAYAKFLNHASDKVVELTLSSLKNSQDNYNGANYIQTTAGVVGGMSGTAVFDMQGRTIGAVSYSYIESRDVTRDYHCRIDHLPDLQARVSELQQEKNRESNQ